MNALIIPLSKHFYFYEKYDGSTIATRFFNKHPRLFKIFNYRIVSLILLGPIITLILIPFLWILVWNIARFGTDEGIDVFGKYVTRFETLLSNPPFRRKNLPDKIEYFNDHNINVFIYYTVGMIPLNQKKKDKFFAKIEVMEKKLNVKKVFYVETKKNIEDVIAEYEIDVPNSFFISDGNIHLDSFRELKPTSEEI